MKLIVIALGLLCVHASSYSQQSTDPKKLASGIKAMMKATVPGTLATSASGYTMTCKIDGKAWSAVSMMPLKGIDRALGYSATGDYIGIPSITQDCQPGLKLKLGESRAADIYLKNDKSLVDKNGNVILLDKQVGKIEITKRNGDWIEGKFYFTSSSSTAAKKVVVTEGFFRVK